MVTFAHNLILYVDYNIIEHNLLILTDQLLECIRIGYTKFMININLLLLFEGN